jgi:hypothetical protein
MTIPAERPLTLPRRLAIRLLHEAQIAIEPFFGLVSAAAEPDAEPDAWLPMTSAAAIVTLPMQLEAQGRRAWALYFFRPSLPATPVPEDFAVLPALLRLTASLATKGVLQLRAWQLVDGRVSERELHIHD